MAWLAVEKDGTEVIHNIKPIRGTKIKNNEGMWALSSIDSHYILLPKDTIKKLIGKDLTWDNDPVEI